MYVLTVYEDESNINNKTIVGVFVTLKRAKRAIDFYISKNVNLADYDFEIKKFRKNELIVKDEKYIIKKNAVLEEVC